jgi:hypothetical protein
MHVDPLGVDVSTVALAVFQPNLPRKTPHYHPTIAIKHPDPPPHKTITQNSSPKSFTSKTTLLHFAKLPPQSQQFAKPDPSIHGTARPAQLSHPTISNPRLLSFLA